MASYVHAQTGHKLRRSTLTVKQGKTGICHWLTFDINWWIFVVSNATIKVRNAPIKVPIVRESQSDLKV
jgi:hypothetical protein